MNRIIEFLRDNDAETYKALQPALKGSVVDYLSQLLPPKGFGRAIDNAPKRFLVDTLASHLGARLPPLDAQLACAEFAENPVLQLADHSDLLLDIETFFHNWFHQIAAREMNLRFLFTQQCSRVRLCHSARQMVGPGYLHTDVDVLNVFGLSKKMLRRHSAATLKNARFQFVPMGVRQPSYSHPRLPEALEPLAGSTYSRATVAVHDGNAHIWNQLTMKAKKERIQLDEDFTCDVLLAHARDCSSWMHTVLFRANERSDFLRCREREIRTAKCRLLKNTTDFFWYDRDGEIRPVRIRDGTGDPVLIDGVDGREIGLSLTPEDVCTGLMNRTLYPDLIVSYGILSVLPCVIALGGPSQQEYHAIISRIFDSFSGGGIKQAQKHSQHSGSRMIAGLLDVSPAIRKLIGGLSCRTDLDAFENEALQMPLRRALGGMSYFGYLSAYY